MKPAVQHFSILSLSKSWDASNNNLTTITSCLWEISLTQNSITFEWKHIQQSLGAQVSEEPNGGHQSKDVERVQLVLLVCFIWLFYQYSYARSTLLLQIWAPQEAAMLVYSSQLQSKKGWIVCLTLLSHVLTLFATSLMQTAGHKMVAFTVRFSCLLNKKSGQERTEKLLWAFFMPFLLTAPVSVLQFSPL